MYTCVCVCVYDLTYYMLVLLVSQNPRDGITILIVILKKDFKDQLFQYSHSRHEETEAQRSEPACPESHS